MSTHDIPPEPKIRVLFKGFIITHIQDGESSAWVGAIAPRHSVCHKPKIHVYRIDTEGEASEISGLAFDLGQDFGLFVENTGQSGIHVYQADDEPFNRLDDFDNDRRDFRWFVNLDQIHGKTVMLDSGQLQPKFILNSGLFHTSARSDGEMRILRYGKSAKRFGRIAMEITARIYFDQINTRADFKNGNKRLLAIEPLDPYGYDIIFDCNCHNDSELSDFPLVYKAISNVLGGEQVGFEPFGIYESERAAIPAVVARSPEAYCTGGNTSG